MTTHIAAAALKDKLSNGIKEVHVDNPIGLITFDKAGDCEVNPIAQWNGNGNVAINVVEVIHDGNTVELIVAHLGNKYAKIYRGIADVDLPILNMVTGLNIISKVGTRWTPLYSKSSRELISNIDGDNVTFFDGTVLECLMGDSFVPQTPSPFPSEPRRPHRFADIQTKRPQQSMFGESSIFQRPNPNTPKEGVIQQLNEKVESLTSELAALTKFVKENVQVVIKHAGIKLMKVDEGLTDDEMAFAGVLCDWNSRVAYYPFQKGAATGYFMKDDEWYISTEDCDSVMSKWTTEFLKHERNFKELTEDTCFSLHGALFSKIPAGGKRALDTIALHTFYTIDGYGQKIAITTHTNGVGYLAYHDDWSSTVFTFNPSDFDYSKVELSAVPVNRQPMPKAMGYAGTAPIGAGVNMKRVQEVRAAVRATIVQYGKDKINYFRANQLIVNQDFKLNRLPMGAPTIKSLEGVNPAELYQFRLNDGTCVYVVCGDALTLYVLDLTEQQYVQLETLNWRKSQGNLYKHCLRLAKRISK